MVAVAEGKVGSTNLGAEASFFAAQVTPRIIAPLLVIALAARLAFGGWSLGDLVVVGVMIAVQPFVEWMIHVFILHWKPKTLFGKKFDPLVSRKHREHHADPKRIEWIFVPLPVLAKALPATALLWFLLMPTVPLALTAITTGLALLLIYEWTHYLIHSRYKPKTRLYKYIWRSHRLHHFKNEHYWFGVTNPLGDHALRTFPAKEGVATSPTCKTLNAESSLGS